MKHNPHGLNIGLAMTTLDRRRRERDAFLAAARENPQPRPGWIWSRIKGWREKRMES